MLNSILIDAGPLIALFDSSEKRHKPMKAFLKKHPYRYISTLAVFTEVSHMLDFSVNAQRDFYEWVMCKGVIISDINQNDMPRLIELTGKYRDLPMDFADATLVITAEKTGIREIISLDWGVGSREWGMGSGEWGVGSIVRNILVKEARNDF